MAIVLRRRFVWKQITRELEKKIILGCGEDWIETEMPAWRVFYQKFTLARCGVKYYQVQGHHQNELKQLLMKL